MTEFQRPLVDKLIRRLSWSGKQTITAVMGPRQTGKTTLILQALRRMDVPFKYLAADDPSQDEVRLGESKGAHGKTEDGVRDTGWIVRIWEAARETASSNSKGMILAFDEVQYIEGWSRVVKGLWDRDRRSDCPLKVIVAGSAPWSMLVGFHESLAGRFMPVDVSHWSFSEMKAAFGFGLEEYVFYGGYPGPASYVEDPEEWRGYLGRVIIAPSVNRDIVALTRVDKPALMRRLMTQASGYSGQIVSYDKMLGQLQDAGNKATLAGYLDLLSDASLVTGLSRYRGTPALARDSTPKLIALNTALITAPSPYTFEEAVADRTFWGRLVESAVGAHLRNTCPHGVDLHYWRKGPFEVDFVLSSVRDLVAIEVKSGRRQGSLRGLTEFAKRHPSARTMVVGGQGVPVGEFLSHPAMYWIERSYPERAALRAEVSARYGVKGKGPADEGIVREPRGTYTIPAGHLPHEERFQRMSTALYDLRKEGDKYEYIAFVRQEAEAIAERGEPFVLLRRVARTYLPLSTKDGPDESLASVRALFDSDEHLVRIVLGGLVRVLERDDLPNLDEIVRLDEEGLMSGLSYQFMAGLVETDRAGGEALREAGQEQILRALGFYYLASYQPEPAWYGRVLGAHPGLVAEALVAVYSSRIRRRVATNRDLQALARDSRYATVAQLAVPPLLLVFPTRCTKPQISALKLLLQAALRYMPAAGLLDLTRRKAAVRGMDVAQRAHWLATGLCLSPDEYLAAVVDFIEQGRETRAEHLTRFLEPLAGEFAPEVPKLPWAWELGEVVEWIGRWGVRPPVAASP